MHRASLDREPMDRVSRNSTTLNIGIDYVRAVEEYSRGI